MVGRLDFLEIFFLDSPLIVGVDLGELLPVQLLARVPVDQFDVILADVVLHSLFDPSVVQGRLQVCDVPATLEELAKLILHKEKNLADLAMGEFGGQLTIGGVGHVLDLVLGDVLRHHSIVEAERISVCLVVVELTALWLDQVRLARAARIVNSVPLRAVDVSLDQGLVIPRRILLVYKALGRTRVLDLIVSVELAHQFVKIVPLDQFFSQVPVFTRLMIRAPHSLSHKAVELCLKLGRLSLKNWIAELAANLARVGIRNGMILHSLRVPRIHGADWLASR